MEGLPGLECVHRCARIDGRDLGDGGVLYHHDVVEAAKIGARQQLAPGKRRGLFEGRNAHGIVSFLRVAPLRIGPTHLGDGGLESENRGR